jgi:hypothetical protein
MDFSENCDLLNEIASSSEKLTLAMTFLGHKKGRGGNPQP